MKQISTALQASRAKEDAAFDRRVTIALPHLRRVLGEMNEGSVKKHTRDEVVDHLIRDGVLGREARTIAHAKKYSRSLDPYKAQLAERIVKRVLELAAATGDITISNTPTSFEVQLTEPYAPPSTPLPEYADLDANLDPDEWYPLHEHLPPHQAQKWGIHRA